jgi:two-component system response regulator TctD
MTSAGRLVRKERLISEVFSFDDAVAPNAIELYIARLRQKLGSEGPKITTIRGLGYMMEGK